MPRAADRTAWKVYSSSVFHVLNELARQFGVKPLSRGRPRASQDFRLAEAFKDYFYDFGKALDQKTAHTRDRRQLLAAVRAALILADGAASGLGRELRQLSDGQVRTLPEVIAGIHDRIGRCFQREPITAEYIDRNVIEPRMRQLGIASLHPWQEEALSYRDRALLIAGCGLGKTMAGWEFMKGVVARHKNIRFLAWLFPTRTTANEIFRDYAAYVPEAHGVIVHSTSAYELEKMLLDEDYDEDDPRRGKDFRTNNRLFGIGYWPKWVFCATIDQFVGFMQNSYQSICFLPILANAALVVDEAHSFDPDLFAAFRKFLQAFDIPCLAMTATMQPTRRQDLENLGFQAYPQNPSLLEQYKELAAIDRYRVRRLPDLKSALGRAIKAYARGHRVLWVVNTVGKCQALVAELRAQLQQDGLPPRVMCYHSVFRLDHRNERHRATVDAFRPGQPPVGNATCATSTTTGSMQSIRPI